MRTVSAGMLTTRGGYLSSLGCDEAIFLLLIRVEEIAFGLHKTACRAVRMPYARVGGTP